MGLATVETNKSVKKFVDSIEDDSKRDDAKKLVKIFEKITKKRAKIWGDNFIIGFGKYKYKRKNGKEEFEWFNAGFAPRKDKITIYLTCDISREKAALKKLGKCKFGKGCLYIKKLDDIDVKVLEGLIKKYKDASWF